ncbi:hypothetical protein FBZ85_101465 [Azospirillum brasilense]|uniref:hypothetical protein n=1 Tax=Azospirillum baldaniorum TaxID=1064539 RepID=UPI001013D74B|nr:hypothetical protein [Azospirillum baldaniorum]TWA83716.1 hypothetical protein FBZ85_101465 [Azospirillum brasilense]
MHADSQAKMGGRMLEILQTAYQFSEKYNVWILSSLISSIIVGWAARAPFVNADKWMPEFVSRIMAEYIDIGVREAGKIGGVALIARKVFEHMFGENPDSLKFFFRSAAFSVAALMIFSCVFFARLSHLYSSNVLQAEVIYNFLEILSVVGVLVNVIVDYMILGYFLKTLNRIEASNGVIEVMKNLFKDLLYKLCVFSSSFFLVYYIGIHGNGNDAAASARAVADTVVSGLGWNDMSSVFLYSSLFSSFWLAFVSLSVRIVCYVDDIAKKSPIIAWLLPFSKKPFLALGNLVGMVAAACNLLTIILF